MAGDLVDLRRAALSCFERGDAPRLAIAAQAVLDYAPEDADIRRLMGRAALKDLRPAEALPWLREAAARAPDRPGSWIDLARALMETGAADEARASLAAARSCGVNSCGLTMLEGVILARLGHEDAARSLFEAAIEIDPASADPYRGLASLGALAPGGRAHERAQRLARDPATPDALAAAVGFALAEAHRLAGDGEGFFARLTDANARHRRAWGKTKGTAPLSGRALDKALQEADALHGRMEPIGPTSVIIVGGEARGAGYVGALAARALPDAAWLDDSPYPRALLRALETATGGRGAPSKLGQVDDAALLDLLTVHRERVCAVAGRASHVIEHTALDGLGLVLLSHLLPHARFLRVTRDAMDTGLEIWRRPEGEGAPHTSELAAIGRDERRYVQDAALTDAALGDRIAHIAYEDAVAAPPSALAEALTPLGLEPHATLGPARTPARLAARPPLALLSPDAWQAHAVGLSELRAGLGPLAQADGARGINP